MLEHAPVLIVARLGSSRLPLKHLSEVAGKPIIEHLIDRVKCSNRVGDIVLCTTDLGEDLPMVEVAARTNITVFRGDPTNVPKRLYDAAIHLGSEFSVIVEADEVFCDWVLVDKLIERYYLTKSDVVNFASGPIGSHIIGIRTDLLQVISDSLGNVPNTDGWLRYFTNPGSFSFRLEELEADDYIASGADLRLTLDWPEDLLLIEAIFERLYSSGEIFTLEAVIKLLEANPNMLKINSHLIAQYEDHMKNYPTIPHITS